MVHPIESFSTPRQEDIQPRKLSHVESTELANIDIHQSIETTKSWSSLYPSGRPIIGNVAMNRYMIDNKRQYVGFVHEKYGTERDFSTLIGNSPGVTTNEKVDNLYWHDNNAIADLGATAFHLNHYSGRGFTPPMSVLSNDFVAVARHLAEHSGSTENDNQPSRQLDPNKIILKGYSMGGHVALGAIPVAKEQYGMDVQGVLANRPGLGHHLSLDDLSRLPELAHEFPSFVGQLFRGYVRGQGHLIDLSPGSLRHHATDLMRVATSNAIDGIKGGEPDPNVKIILTVGQHDIVNQNGQLVDAVTTKYPDTTVITRKGAEGSHWAWTLPSDRKAEHAQVRELIDSIFAKSNPAPAEPTTTVDEKPGRTKAHLTLLP